MMVTSGGLSGGVNSPLKWKWSTFHLGAKAVCVCVFSSFFLLDFIGHVRMEKTCKTWVFDGMCSKEVESQFWRVGEPDTPALQGKPWKLRGLCALNLQIQISRWTCGEALGNPQTGDAANPIRFRDRSSAHSTKTLKAPEFFKACEAHKYCTIQRFEHAEHENTGKSSSFKHAKRLSNPYVFY